MAEQQQPGNPPGKAPSGVVSDNPELANAINLADKVRSRVSKYPHSVRTEPPLPHGFVEGALVGLGTYMLFWPVRAQAMKLVGRSKQWSHTKPYVGIFCTAGQALVGAKAALYTAVLVGSKAWLETLVDFAASAGKQNYHKSVLAGELCQDPILQNQKVVPTDRSSLNTTTKDVSLTDWLRDPEQVVIQELFRAVRNCQNRANYSPPEVRLPVQADDRKL